jgi:uncharacterized protein
LYSKEWTALTYSALIDKASSALAEGHSVVLDASFVRHADRQAAARLAQKVVAQGVNIIFLECACPREVALQRLAQRWQNRVAREQPHDLAEDETALLASDGRPDLYDAQCAAWQAFDPTQEAGMTHFVIDTTLPLAVNIEQVLETLHVPRRACWLEASTS